MCHLHRPQSLVQAVQRDCFYPTLMLVSYINYSRILESHLEDDSERDRVFQEKPCCQLYLKLSPAIDCERSRCEIKTIFPTVSGIELCNWFSKRSRCESKTIFPIVSGIEPCSWLSERSRCESKTIFPTVSGIEPCRWLPERSRCESKTIFWLRKHKKAKKVLKGPYYHGLQVMEERLCNCWLFLMNSEETKHSHIYSICFCLESLTLPYERST